VGWADVWAGLPSLQLSPDAGGKGPGRQLARLVRRGLGWASYGMGNLILPLPVISG